MITLLAHVHSLPLSVRSDWCSELGGVQSEVSLRPAGQAVRPIRHYCQSRHRRIRARLVSLPLGHRGRVGSNRDLDPGRLCALAGEFVYCSTGWVEEN